MRRIVFFICFLHLSPPAFSQDTIWFADDTVRVGGLEWDIEKDLISTRPVITSNPDVYGDRVRIFHGFHPQTRTIEQIVFGFEDNGLFIPHGPARYYYPAGELLGKRLYEWGKLNGPATDYHRNGMVKMIATFKDDSLSGEFKTYYEEGIVEQYCHFEHGKIDGTLYQFFNNGALKSTSHFDAGVKNGGDTTYYDTGDIWQIDHYENDLLHGSSKSFHRNGKAEREWIYEEGRLIKIVFVQSDEAHPLEPGNFSEGNGIVFFYNDRGLLKFRAKYKNGIQKWMKPVRKTRPTTK